MQKSRLIVSLAASALAATALAGCSSETVDEASSAYCDQLDSLSEEVDALRALVVSDATVEEVNDQREAVREAYDATVSAAESLDEAIVDAASGAYDSFESSVGDIPGDVALSEAAGQYTDASDAFVTDLASIASDAGCS